MVNIDDQYASKRNINGYATKKCPHCYTHLALKAKVCTACSKKVGEVDKLGFAKKPFDWSGYLIAMVSIAVFAVFIWWAFFRE